MACTGNAMKFLDSQHNLRHSNLSEIPIEDSNKIFKGRPSLGSSDAGISSFAEVLH